MENKDKDTGLVALTIQQRMSSVVFICKIINKKFQRGSLLKYQASILYSV